MPNRAPIAVRATFVAIGVWLALYAGAALLGVKGDLPWLYGRYAHVVVVAGVCATLLTRTLLIEDERRAWAFITAAALCWTLGELDCTAAIWTDPSHPVPTLADAAYVAAIPFAFAGMIALLLDRAPHSRLTSWIDGIVAALVVGAYGAALVFHETMHGVHGSGLAKVTAIAYPLCDFMVLGIVVTLVASAGWRLHRSGVLLVLGILLFSVGDSVIVIAASQSEYSAGGIADVAKWAGFLCIGLSAWCPAGQILRRSSQDTMSTVVTSVVFGTLGLLLLFIGDDQVNDFALVLAALALLGVLARLLITFHEKNQLLDGTRRQALTDSLTGLGNSRGMRLELDRRFTGDVTPFALVLFDLDGFKPYNDRFGHPAGDALLERAGRRVTQTVDGSGAAYRAGGDEFCVMLDCDPDSVAAMLKRCRDALSEHGEGFAVCASAGIVRVPEEAADASSAMRLADLRLYDEKHLRNGDPRHHAARALVQIMREQSAERSSHLSRVARLARAVCRELKLPAEQIDEAVRAAELHDIGMIAIPDSLLEKREALSDEERAFIERHPVIGERVIGAAPTLATIARIVRATHERWDGTGYPDRIAGEAIPVEARVILACNAYDALTSDRPYRERRWPAEALAELRANAGTQFDPAVIVALQAAVRGGADVAPDYVVGVAASYV